MSLQGTQAKVTRDITEVGLPIDGTLSFEAWEALGARLGIYSRGHQWAIGDWLRWGHSLFGERSSQAIEATGLEESTLRQYLYTAERIEPHRRRRGLSFSHHSLVAGLLPADQEVWLTKALAGGWSVSELRIAMQVARHGLPSGGSSHAGYRTRAADDEKPQDSGLSGVNQLEAAKAAWVKMNHSQRVAFREWLSLEGRKL